MKYQSGFRVTSDRDRSYGFLWLQVHFDNDLGRLAELDDFRCNRAISNGENFLMYGRFLERFYFRWHFSSQPLIRKQWWEIARYSRENTLSQYLSLLLYKELFARSTEISLFVVLFRSFYFFSPSFLYFASLTRCRRPSVNWEKIDDSRK